MTKTFQTALMFAALSAFAYPAAAAPIIVNGSFEDTTGLTDNIDFFDGVPIGWSFTGNIVQLLTSSITDAPSGIDGDLYLEINDSGEPGPFGTLSQSVTGLTVGQEYEVAFLWGNRGSFPNDSYDFTVAMGGATFSRSGSGLVNLTAASIQFLASSSTEELRIIFNDPGVSTVTGGGLDAFEIQAVDAVPEPSTTALLSLSAAGFAVYRRRRPGPTLRLKSCSRRRPSRS